MIRSCRKDNLVCPAPDRGSSFVCVNKKGLETILPHRGTALRRIDGVFLKTDQPDVIYGVKEVLPDDPDLDGHFPDAPTYPGYAQDEFVCLVAAVLVLNDTRDRKINPHVVQKTARYRKRVIPGDRLIAEVRLLARRGRFMIFSGMLRDRAGETVAEYEKIVGAF